MAALPVKTVTLTYPQVASIRHALLLASADWNAKRAGLPPGPVADAVDDMIAGWLDGLAAVEAATYRAAVAMDEDSPF